MFNQNKNHVKHALLTIFQKIKCYEQFYCAVFSNNTFQIRQSNITSHLNKKINTAIVMIFFIQYLDYFNAL